MVSSEKDIYTYLRLISMKKRLFFAFAAGIMAVFVLAGYILPKKYEAKCTVLVVQSVYDDYVRGIAITPSGEQGLGGLSYAIKSKSLILKVLRDLGIVTDATTLEKKEKMVAAFQEKTLLAIQPNRANPVMTDLFTVSFRDTNPELARDYVNTLVRRYIQENISGKREDTSEARQLLSGQVSFFKRKIDALETQLARFSPGNAVLVNPDDAKIREELLPLQKRLAELSVAYTDDYPEVIAIKTEISSLKDRLARPSSPGGSENTTEDTRKKQQELERERNTYKKIYEELVVRLSQSEVSQQMGSSAKGAELFSISEPAVLPTKPVSAARINVILMGILAGLAGGAGMVVLLDTMDHSVKSAKAVRALGLPVLAVIPKIQSEKQLQQEKIRNAVFYCVAGLYMLGILALAAIEALGLPYADAFAQQSLTALKASVKSIL